MSDNDEREEGLAAGRPTQPETPTVFSAEYVGRMPTDLGEPVLRDQHNQLWAQAGGALRPLSAHEAAAFENRGEGALSAQGTLAPAREAEALAQHLASARYERVVREAQDELNIEMETVTSLLDREWQLGHTPTLGVGAPYKPRPHRAQSARVARHYMRRRDTALARVAELEDELKAMRERLIMRGLRPDFPEERR